MENRITLDYATFRALASETRVSLLKKLSPRRKTASELAKEEGITVQSATEHLEKLCAAGLAARASEAGRKWVYYGLTEKGKGLLEPNESKNVWVLLGLSALALAAGGYRSVSSASPPAAQYASQTAVPEQATPAFAKGAAIAGDVGRGAIPSVPNALAANAASPSLAAATPTPESNSAATRLASGITQVKLSPIEIALIIAGTALAAFVAYELFKKNKAAGIAVAAALALYLALVLAA